MKSQIFAAICWALCSATAVSAQSKPLNDTGQTTCANAAGSTVSCADPTAVQGQDARYGRDAAAGTGALTKTGAGANGFDYTKISNAGVALPASVALGAAATDWACTKDNVTGLIWEVKTTSGLRSSSHGYSWFNSNPLTNGGSNGVASTVTTGTLYCATNGRCDTEKFVADVNATALCGFTDWRMPTLRELLSIVKVGDSPTIDGGFFPNTLGSSFWSGSPSANNSSYAWFVSFLYGNADYYYVRSNNFRVRLVRGGQ